MSRCVHLLGVSRSGFYAWRARQRRGPGPRASRRAMLGEKIVAFHDASDGVNGAPRIVADLRADGEVVSQKTVAKLLRDNGIAGISPRGWRPVTTITDQSPHSTPDVVERRFDRGGLNVVWTSDITYLATDQGWLYLCTVRDGCSRRVIGYACADSLHTDLVETAVRNAMSFRDPVTGSTDGVIFHADRGCQYTSAQMAEVAEELDLRLSVGRTGVCWDNAQQEMFLVDVEDRVLRSPPLRQSPAGHHRGQPLDRHCLQPAPPAQCARTDRSSIIRTQHDSPSGQPGRLTDVH